LDEFERDEIVEEEQPEEEILEEEQPEEELTEEEEEEQPPKKSDKPIKGPRFWTWALAVLLMLSGLVMTVPALWNLMLILPAVSGLVSEAGGKYESAQEAYGYMESLESGIQGFGLDMIGLSSGNFTMERRYAIWNKLYGPLVIARNQPLEQYFPAGTRMPRSLRRLAAQSGALTDILEGFYTQLEITMGPAEGQSESEWALEALEAAQALDGQADARALYYESIALQIAAGIPARGEDSRARLAALRKDPAAEPWMYQDAALYFAREDGDYNALAALCDARLKRSREDVMAMQYKVKATFLAGQAEKAFKAADRFARRSAARDGMLLAKAELHYRQGEYGKAIALCDEILDAVDYGAEITKMADLAPLESALAAARAKAVALLLQGKPGEAMDLLNETMASAGMYMQYMNFDYSSYIYTLLAAYIESGDEEGFAAMEAQLAFSGGGAPQAITDLREGKTTIEKIFTEGWGGFDA